MLITVSLSDNIGRRPLTVYPYGITVVSVLALGIIGCFDYSSKSLGSLLVRPVLSLHFYVEMKNPCLTKLCHRSSSPVSPPSQLLVLLPSATPMLQKFPLNDFEPKPQAGVLRCPT